MENGLRRAKYEYTHYKNIAVFKKRIDIASSTTSLLHPDPKPPTKKKQIMEEYNEHAPPMNLVLFDDALDHMTRIHRLFRLYHGNALLVGVGGSGKSSLTRVAAFAAGCEVFEITLSRGYNENNLREDLKVRKKNKREAC